MTDWVSILACPVDRAALCAKGSKLLCSKGHEYPVIQGIPVLVPPPDRDATLWVLDASRRAADGSLRDELLPGHWLETAAISAAERNEVVRLAKTKPAIDPLAAMLVAATNGLLYRD